MSLHKLIQDGADPNRSNHRESAPSADKLSDDQRAIAADAVDLPYTKHLISCKAKQLASSRYFRSTDDDEIEQILHIAVYEGCLKYSSEKGALQPFIATVVKNQVHEIIRHRQARKRSPRYEVGSLNQIVDTHWGSAQWVEVFDNIQYSRPRGGQARDDVEQFALKLDLEAALAQLNEETREVAQLLMHHSALSVEKKLGMTRGAVRGHISLIREHLEEHEFREYLEN